jgi:hypothetical protein
MLRTILITTTRPIHVYALLLQQNKYYIGMTTREPSQRIAEHMNNKGARWTQIYKPINVDMIYRNCDHYSEDNIVKTYMMIYGIDNVRGGSYSRVKLPDYQIAALHDEFNTVRDVCYKCGSPGHKGKQCGSIVSTDCDIRSNKGNQCNQRAICKN